jgi:hypothetical protein
MNLIYLHALEFMIYKNKCGRRDRDRMVDGFTRNTRREPPTKGKYW